jgi:hypothetical protein
MAATRSPPCNRRRARVDHLNIAGLEPTFTCPRRARPRSTDSRRWDPCPRRQSRAVRTLASMSASPVASRPVPGIHVHVASLEPSGPALHVRAVSLEPSGPCPPCPRRQSRAVRVLASMSVSSVASRLGPGLQECPLGRVAGARPGHLLVALFDDNGKVLRSWEPERGMSLANFTGLVSASRPTSATACSRARASGASRCAAASRPCALPAARSARPCRLLASRGPRAPTRCRWVALSETLNGSRRHWPEANIFRPAAGKGTRPTWDVHCSSSERVRDRVTIRAPAGNTLELRGKPVAAP